MNFFAAQEREQHFRITDIIDITGENIAVEDNEIGVFAEAQGTVSRERQAASAAKVV